MPPVNDDLNKINQQKKELLELKKAREQAGNNADILYESKDANNVELSGKEKLNNLWYYNKWYILIGIIALITVISIVVTFAKKEKYDLTIILSTKEYISSQHQEELAKRIELYMTDYDNNGRIKVQIISLPFDVNVLSPAQSIETTNRMKLLSELTTANTVLVFLDEDKYEFLNKNEFFTDLNGEYPGNDKIKGGRWILKDSELINTPALSEIFSDLSLSIRVEPDKMDDATQKRYEHSKELLNNIINDIKTQNS